MGQEKKVIKIALLDHSPEIGGAEASVLTLLKHIDRSQFQVRVVLPSRGSFAEELNKIGIQTDILSLPMELLRLKRGSAIRSFFFIAVYLLFIQVFLVKLFFYFKKNGFDLVVTNTVKAHLYGSIAASLSGIPLVWRFHDILSSSDFSLPLIRCIVLFGRVFPKRILAVSNVTKDHLMESGFKANHVQVIYNGIDQGLLETKARSKSLREELRLGDGVRLVGCIGRIVPQKGQKSFLLAIPGVIQKYPETCFLVVGEVLHKEEKYREELLEIVKRNGIENRIRFTGFRRDIGEVIRSLDIVVFPSVAPESFGLSILESMVLGKPVIASKIGGVCEIIEDGYSGILVEPGRPEQITDRILYLFGNQEVCGKIGQRARETVHKMFPLRNYVTAMEKAFKEVALKEAGR